jgi:hypothetical protein
MRRTDVAGDFARRAMLAQPLTYTKVVATDFLRGFAPTKRGSPGEFLVRQWQFQETNRIFRRNAKWSVTPPVGIGGDSRGHVNQSLASFLRTYQRYGYTPGPLLAVGLLAGLAAAFGVGRARRSDLRAPAFLFAAVALAVCLGTAAVSLFSLRYLLPELVLLPAALVLGLTAITSASGEAALGTRARTRRHGAAASSLPDVERAAVRAFEEQYGDVSLAPVAVVIPAFDEEEAIGGVLTEIPSEANGLAVDTLVVDDGSRDRTRDAALAHGAYVARMEQNSGQGAALRVGYRLARDHGARYVVTLDADGQWDPGDVPRLLEPVLADEADFVLGSRVLGRADTDDSVRSAGVRVFALLVRLLTGVRVTDTSSGVRVLRAEVTETVRQEEPQYQASELLVGAICQGYRIRELPVVMHKRTAGASKKGHNFLYGLRYARVLFRTWRRERRNGRGR